MRSAGLARVDQTSQDFVDDDGLGDRILFLWSALLYERRLRPRSLPANEMLLEIHRRKSNRLVGYDHHGERLLPSLSLAGGWREV